MQKPMSPPDLSSLMTGSLPARFGTILAAVQGTDDRYLHWDDLRYRNPPEDLTHEEWWFGLKIGRQSQYRPIPLADTSGKPFFYSLPDEALKRLQYIERFCSGSISMPEQVTTPGQRDRYVITSLIEEAITSSQLEGASTSRKVAKQMIESGRPPRSKSERMILNNYFAMHRVGEIRASPLSEDLFLGIHRIVSAGTMRDTSLEGAYQRPGDDRVEVYAPDDDTLVLHAPPDASELPARIEKMVRFANDEPEQYLPPVVKAIILHFWVGYDHPFEDGNGRTARALFYWSMLHQGYWLAEFLTVSKILKEAPVKYARSYLLSESDDNDLTYFILFHLDVVCRAIDELMAYLGRKSTEMRQVRGLVQGAGLFNHRQIDLLGHALRHPDEIYTIKRHMSHHGVVYQTARTDLMELESRGLFEKLRRGREHVFAPAADIASLLEAI